MTGEDIIRNHSIRNSVSVAKSWFGHGMRRDNLDAVRVVMEIV